MSLSLIENVVHLAPAIWYYVMLRGLYFVNTSQAKFFSRLIFLRFLAVARSRRTRTLFLLFFFVRHRLAA